MKYKVGDRVRIKSLDWYNKNIKNNGIIICGSESFTHPMSHFCDKVVTIVTIQDDRYRILEDDGDWYWTDEMIEGLVKEETKPELKFKVGDKVITDTNMKYEVGDKVLIKDINWYNKNKDEDGDVSCGEFDFVLEMSRFCGKILTIDVVFKDGTYLMKEDTDGFVFTTEMFDTFAEEEVERLTGNLSNSLVNEFELPDGYIFKDENGNVINATKIVLEKKKKEYPKTYEECREIIKLGKEHTLEGATIRINYKIALLESFQKLLICRDAYWKIAGEEMRLGKPWEPDWENSEERRYSIVNIEGDINLPEKTLTKWILKVTNKILVFPTEEMRDAFYENFKELIEQCKELL